MTKLREGAAQQVSAAHPSWYPKVLATLARDHPDISEEVWAKTITENAIRNTEEAGRS